MRHNSTLHNPQDDHYAASVFLNELPVASGVLAQIQEGESDGYPHTEQARIRLTPAEARHFAQLLLSAADRVEAHLAVLHTEAESAETDEPTVNEAATVQALSCDEPARAPACNPHPDAPHGFNRNASHNADRYVCDCESWEPTPAPEHDDA